MPTDLELYRRWISDETWRLKIERIDRDEEFYYSQRKLIPLGAAATIVPLTMMVQSSSWIFVPVHIFLFGVNLFQSARMIGRWILEPISTTKLRSVNGSEPFAIGTRIWN